MGRPRKEGRFHWPRNLYLTAAGHFWFKNPLTGDTLGLGSSELKAIRDVKLLNACLTIPPREVDLHAPIDHEDVGVDGLQTITAIRRAAEKSSTRCGIYFLLADGQVIYVGQSIDCTRRVIEHMNDP